MIEENNEEEKKEGENSGNELPPDTSTPTEAAKPVEASRLVDDDTDRPVADNKIESPVNPENQTSPGNNPQPQTDAPKKRGRKPYTPEQKAAVAQAKREGKPPPNFSDIKGGVPQNRATLADPNSAMRQRDYVSEFTSIFVPVSMALGKMMGPQFGIPIDAVERRPKLSHEQEMYIMSGAKWLEYEQFPELSPRFGFVLGSITYFGPKFREEPTFSRVKIWYLKTKGFLFGLFNSSAKDKAQKEWEELEKEFDKRGTRHAQELSPE